MQSGEKNTVSWSKFCCIYYIFMSTSKNRWTRFCQGNGSTHYHRQRHLHPARTGQKGCSLLWPTTARNGRWTPWLFWNPRAPALWRSVPNVPQEHCSVFGRDGPGEGVVSPHWTCYTPIFEKYDEAASWFDDSSSQVSNTLAFVKRIIYMIQRHDRKFINSFFGKDFKASFSI